jgi:Capsule assembly protein Wzi
MRCIGCLVLFFGVFLVAANLSASTYIGVGDEIYNILARLEAEGVIQSGLLGTKPISRREAVRLLQEAEKSLVGRSEFIKELVRELKERIRREESEAGSLKIMDSVYGKYISTNADVRTLTYGITREKEQALNYNNDGDIYRKGNNERVGFVSFVDNVSLVGDRGRFSFYLNPEYRSSEGDNDLVLKKAYGVFNFGWDLAGGKDSQWWGPGYNGAVLLSNNAEPFTMVRITNPVSRPLPWIFKHLGPFKFTFFATRLETARNDFPEPYLWGMRFNFKPHPIIEIGLQRTAILGGRGRQAGLNTWLKSLAGRGEHGGNDIGDQRAGYDLKLTLPFSVQPLQLYMESDAEDNIHPLPSQWAYLYGIYLPRVLSLERIGLRAEYASTHLTEHPGPVWYTHHIYTDGYTYKGMIIGHHIGTDSRNVFFELSCRVPEKNARIALSYDQELHNVSGPVRETSYETALNALVSVTQHLDIAASYGTGRIANAGNVAGDGRETRSAGGTITYRF